MTIIIKPRQIQLSKLGKNVWVKRNKLYDIKLIKVNDENKIATKTLRRQEAVSHRVKEKQQQQQIWIKCHGHD